MIIKKRPCRIGPSINTRTEMHCDESVPAMDIPLTGILLDKAELDELLGPHSWDSLYTIKVFAHGWGKRANGRWHLREVELS